MNGKRVPSRALLLRLPKGSKGSMLDARPPPSTRPKKPPLVDEVGRASDGPATPLIRRRKARVLRITKSLGYALFFHASSLSLATTLSQRCCHLRFRVFTPPFTRSRLRLLLSWMIVLAGADVLHLQLSTGNTLTSRTMGPEATPTVRLSRRPEVIRQRPAVALALHVALHT